LIIFFFQLFFSLRKSTTPKRSWKNR